MLSKISHALCASLFLGLALVAFANRTPERPPFSLAKLDFLRDALWEGCRAEAIKRVASKLR
jgi:hypothetical protein